MTTEDESLTFRSEHDEVELNQLRQYMGDLIGVQVVPREVLGGRWSLK